MNISKKIIQTIFSLVFGFIIIFFLYKETNFRLLWIDIKKINWNILSFSLGFGLLGNLIRGIRWEILLHSLNYRPKKSILIYAIFGSYAVNFILPRVGELWRCGILMRKEKIPFVKVAETILFDRISDVIIVFFISLISFFCNIKIIFENLKYFHSYTIHNLRYSHSNLVYLIPITIGIIFFLFMFLKKKKIIRKIHLICKHFSCFLKDFLSICKMNGKKRFIIYSFGIWISYFLYFYTTFYAFCFTSNLGIRAGILIFALSSISMAIPSNGGLGPWQASVIYGLCMFHVSVGHAKAFATAVFTVHSFWVVLCGLISILLLCFETSVFPKQN